VALPESVSCAGSARVPDRIEDSTYSQNSTTGSTYDAFVPFKHSEELLSEENVWLSSSLQALARLKSLRHLCRQPYICR